MEHKPTMTRDEIPTIREQRAEADCESLALELESLTDKEFNHISQLIEDSILKERCRRLSVRLGLDTSIEWRG